MPLLRGCSLYNRATAVVAVLCTILALALPINSQQCPVTRATIVSSSSSDDICAVVTQGTLRYTCNNDNILLIWTSSVFSASINVIASSTTGTIPMPATGVTLVENDNDNTTCLNSTLTFTGTVADLEQLNGVVLTCDDFAGATDNVTIVIPILPGPPTLINVPSSLTCDSDSNMAVTLQWTLPTNTGEQGAEIEYYELIGLPQSASCCPAGPCDRIISTTTIITGLQCNTSYSVAVRAVNCRGNGTFSDPIDIIFQPTPTPSPTAQVTTYTNSSSVQTSYCLTKTITYTVPTVFYRSCSCSCSLFGVIVGVPVAFLTAIISSLLTLLITCLIMRGRSHSKFTPQQQQQGEPVYDPVSAVSSTRPTAVEMKSNVAYGTTATAATAASGNITYETVLLPQ